MNRFQSSLVLLCLAGISIPGEAQNPPVVVDRPRLVDTASPHDPFQSEIQKTMSNLTELPLDVHGTVTAERGGTKKQSEASFKTNFSGVPRAGRKGELVIKLRKEHVSEEAKDAQRLSYKAHGAALAAASAFKFSQRDSLATEAGLVALHYAVDTDKNSFYLDTGVFGKQPTLHRFYKWHGTVYIDAATQKVKGFRFEMDGLPIMAEKMNIWKALVESYVIEAQFTETAVPGNNRPLTILSEITLTVKTNDGITTIHNQYSAADLKNSEQNQGRSQE